jgi:hypothetical protein
VRCFDSATLFIWCLVQVNPGPSRKRFLHQDYRICVIAALIVGLSTSNRKEIPLAPFRLPIQLNGRIVAVRTSNLGFKLPRNAFGETDYLAVENDHSQLPNLSILGTGTEYSQEALANGIVKLRGSLADCFNDNQYSQLLPTSISARYYQPCRLAISSILHALPRC